MKAEKVCWRVLVAALTLGGITALGCDDDDDPSSPAGSAGAAGARPAGGGGGGLGGGGLGGGGLGGGGLGGGGGGGAGGGVDDEAFVYPAEFGPHESMWLAWPTYENKAGMPSEPVVLALIKELVTQVPVDLMAQDDAEIATIQGVLAGEGIPLDRVRLHPIPHGDLWIRDMGPIFLTNRKGGLKVADFKFNLWGYEEATSEGSLLEEKVDRLVAERLGLATVPSNLISEGGNREVNGRGVLLATEAVEVQRNPSLSLVQIEDELKRVLGQKKVIWLKEGVADDDLTFKGPLPGGYFTVITTGGHIDEYARFADEDTILLAEVSEEQKATDEIAAITYERLRVNEAILKNATDQDGKPFEIVRVPVPDKLFETMKAGDGVFDYIQGLTFENGTVIEPDEVIDVVLPASYLNYIITNGLVIYQTYWKPGRPDSMKVNDEKAKAILERTFSPQRRVVGVNAEAVNLGGGGIHCIAQQQPQKVTAAP